ncbi:MAG: dehydrogenase, partial [Chitinophagaceae bacterium]|nr:dehydrogenase [Chitinophagaceae bacterium]
MKKVITCITILTALVVLVFFNQSCNNNSKANGVAYDSLSLKKDLVSPELTPEESMKKMHLQDGFSVQLVAAEPLVIAP